MYFLLRLLSVLDVPGLTFTIMSIILIKDHIWFLEKEVKVVPLTLYLLRLGLGSFCLCKPIILSVIVYNNMVILIFK